MDVKKEEKGRRRRLFILFRTELRRNDIVVLYRNDGGQPWIRYRKLLHSMHKQSQRHVPSATWNRPNHHLLKRHLLQGPEYQVCLHAVFSKEELHGCAWMG
jgi:hypothetical protein